MESSDNYQHLDPIEVLKYCIDEQQQQERLNPNESAFHPEIDNGNLDCKFDTDPLRILKREDTATEASSISFAGEYDEAEFWCGSESLREHDQKTSTKQPNTYAARNGCIWHTTKPLVTAIATDYVMESLEPKGKGPAKVVSNVIEAWHLLLDQPILLHILRFTNERIKRLKSQAIHQRCTDAIELRAWLGLNYLAGIFRAKNQLGRAADLEELWTPELGNSIFRATMSLKRFQFLSACLCLGEPNKRDPESLQEVQTVWEKFVINCRSYYAPSSNCVLTEHILEMLDENCPLKHNLPHDNTRQGIRLVSLHDAKTLYMCNTVITPTAAPTQREVLTLICDIKGTERTLTTTQRYTALDLAQTLRQYRLQLVGALEATATEVPVDFINSGCVTTLYNDATRLVASASGRTAATQLIMTSNLSERLNVQRLYNVTTQSAARFYALAGCYSSSAAAVTADSNSYAHYAWPLSFFHAVLDFACINAWVLLRLSDKGDPKQTQRDFQRQLGLYLTQQHLKRRLQKNYKISLQLKLLIAEILGEPSEALLQEAVNAKAQATSAGAVPTEKLVLPADFQLLPKTTPTRKRCRGCPSKNNNKTRWQCQQCARVICLKHMVMRCEACTGVKLPPSSNEEEEFFK